MTCRTAGGIVKRGGNQGRSGPLVVFGGVPSVAEDQPLSPGADMGATYRRELHLVCDHPECFGCERALDDMDAHPKTATATNLKRAAIREGWTNKSGQWFCPECSRRDKR